MARESYTGARCHLYLATGRRRIFLDLLSGVTRKKLAVP